MSDGGLNQTQVGELLGVNDSTVCRWLKAERRPGLREALKLRDQFGIALELWLEEAAT